MAEDALIVGSGPSGVSAAHALLERGRRVLMLDVGVTLEPENDARARRMGAVDPDAWSADDRRSALAPAPEGDAGMRPYGSDFARRDVVGFFAGGAPADVALRPSFARGGLSNGWGSAVAPYRIEDLGDWPARARDLAPHYAAVSRFMPISARKDDLAEALPMWSPEGSHDLPSSPQARALLDRLGRRKDALVRAGVVFGKARQAVRSGCRQCQMCLRGCPYRLIYSAAHSLDALLAHPNFRYRAGCVVEAFSETPEGVTVAMRSAAARESIAARRLFIATGVLPTARLILGSIAKPSAALTLKDSQHALTPLLHAFSPPRGLANAPQHTLTQIFLELLSADAPCAHVQIYTYNDDYEKDLKARFGPAAGALSPLIGVISRRLLVAQIFLHSDLSGSMTLSLGPGGALDIRANANPATAPAMAATIARLRRALSPAGVAALPFLARHGAIGSSFHCGGSLPMRDAPSGLETDILGRPAGLSRVHVVDASVLPSIPATTITFSVMANAHRIAMSAPD
jgi:choline dehydrogenase-like flavoprotein